MSQATIAYTSPDQCCDCCDSCHCGTDCATGTVSMNRTYLATNFGSFSIGYYGQFKLSGAFADPDFYAGTNILVEGWAYVTQVGSLLAFTWGPNRALWFDANSFAAKFGARQILSQPATNDYRIFDPDSGIAYTFDVSLGLLRVVTMPGGQTATNTIPNGKVTATTWRDENSVVREIRKFLYHSTTGLLEFATLQRTDDDSTQFARVALTYYDDESTSNGNDGDLRSASYQLPDGSGGWTTVGTDYFRYYTSSTTPGFVHGLKYVVKPEEFASLGSNPDSAADTTVAAVADAYYEYGEVVGGQNTRRVTKSTTLGDHWQTFAYTASTTTATNDFNDWRLKMTVSYKDGSQKIVYSNNVRQVMLSDHTASPTNPNQGRWIEYTKYHATFGRVFERYTPASINMGATPIYTQTAPGLAATIRPTAGLVNVTSYYAASPPSGGMTGYPSETSVRLGATGASTVLQSFFYGTQQVSGETLVYLSKIVQYRNDNATGPITTEYVLTFYSATFQTQTRTTRLPIVPASQNGDDNQYGIVETMDRKGRLTNRTDAYDLDSPPSHIPSTSYAYEDETGAVIQMTQDPGGVGLVTDFDVDDFGRTILAWGPSHNVNGQTVRTAAWTVYMDAQHEVRTAQGYRVSTTDTLVNPVSITKTDRNGRVLQEIEAVRSSTSGPLTAGDAFSQTDYCRWTTRTYTSGDLTSVKVYHDIPSSSPGSQDANYAETNHEYDSMGRMAKTTSPGNGGIDGVGGSPVLRTITWHVFDVRDNVIQTFVGTDATDGSFAYPDNNSESTPNDMVLTASLIYDGDNPVGGDNRLTREIQHVDGTSANDRITDYAYDFRGRRTTVTQDPNGSQPIITAPQYDNLGQSIQVDQYQNSVTSAHRIAQSKASFDDRGQVYLTRTYGVVPGDGSPVRPQNSNTWYDGNGRVARQQPAGSKAYTKATYDALGRTTDTYVGYSPDDDDDPWTVGSGDKVFEQSHSDYDAAGNVTKTTSYQRNVDATGGGALTTTNARVTYAGHWYDGVGRAIASANYGTSDFDRGSQTSAPTSSADVLVSQTAYNPRGEAFETTDPAGTVTETEFDDAGRAVSTQQTGPDSTTTATSMTYTPDGGVRTLTAVNSTTGSQTTQYVYGAERPNNVFGTVARSDLLVAEIYPDSADGADNVAYKYNRQADRVQMTDQNGTVHQYNFDRFGRPIADNVTHFESSDVDQTVKRIEIAYEVRGMVSQVTSRDAVSGGNVVDQVSLDYNEFRQLKYDKQSHSGAVDGSTPKVQYDYADGSANTTRRTKVTYPYGNDLVIAYSSAGDDDDGHLSRVSSLEISTTTGHSVEYNYFGLGSVAKVRYPQPTVNMVLADGAPSYPGIDKFGRIIDLYWKKDSGSDPERVHLTYGYDCASNRKYRRDEIARALTQPFDELYSYDGVHRLTSFGRGTLQSGNESVTGTTQTQTWTLDQTGNWSVFEQASPSLRQLRLHNEANEIEPNYPTVDPDRINKQWGDYWPGPLHDRNGNMTKMPQPATPTAAYTAKYDAWNRLVELKDGTTVVASFQYDGLNRRTTKTIGSTARHFFYSDRWQVLEERVGASTSADQQFIWGIRYVDDLILRDRSVTGTLDERRFAVQDANCNVVAILDTSGGVDERFVFEVYGEPIELSAAYVPQADARSWDTRYTGQRYDPTFHLYYSRTRYYHSKLGRWLVRDPSVYVDGENMYLYVGDNPSNLQDPFGLEACCCCVDDVDIQGGKPKSERSAREFVVGGVKKLVPIMLLGHEFWVVINLRHEKADVNQPCHLYWGEASSAPNVAGVKPLEWFDVMSDALKGLAEVPGRVAVTLSEWIKYQSDAERQAKKCSELPRDVTLWDFPNLADTGVGVFGGPIDRISAMRDLYFFIVVQSGGPNCKNKEVRVCAHQHLVIKRGTLDEQRSFFKSGPCSTITMPAAPKEIKMRNIFEK